MALAGGVTTRLVVLSLTTVPGVPPKVTALPVVRKFVPVMVTLAGGAEASAAPWAGEMTVIVGDAAATVTVTVARADAPAMFDPR